MAGVLQEADNLSLFYTHCRVWLYIETLCLSVCPSVCSSASTQKPWILINLTLSLSTISQDNSSGLIQREIPFNFKVYTVFVMRWYPLCVLLKVFFVLVGTIFFLRLFTIVRFKLFCTFLFHKLPDLLVLFMTIL